MHAAALFGGGGGLKGIFESNAAQQYKTIHALLMT
jgi:hypothetical protein